jgi:hypothetical protein
MAEAKQIPDKYFDDQFDDEEVLFVFRKHPVVMRKGLVFGMVGPLLGILPSWISWHFSVFIVTDQRFIQISQKGLFHRAVADLGLQQIQSVNYEVAGLQETLLGFGTIMMQTYVGDLTIHDVHKPAKIQKEILSVLRKEGVNIAQYPAIQAISNINEETEDQEA